MLKPTCIQFKPEIRLRYQYQFGGYMPQFEQGWMPLVIKLVSTINSLLLPKEKHLFKWLMFKNRNGSLKIYCNYAAHHFANKEKILYSIRKVEEQTLQTCMECGCDDGVALEETQNSGYMATLCLGCVLEMTDDN